MKGKSKTLETGVTEEYAKAHCSDPETSYKTCTKSAGKARTRKYGPWFDYYLSES
jgi:hypothetical protein